MMKKWPVIAVSSFVFFVGLVFDNTNALLLAIWIIVTQSYVESGEDESIADESKDICPNCNCPWHEEWNKKCRVCGWEEE